MRKYSELSEAEQLVYWTRLMIVGTFIVAILTFGVLSWSHNHHILTEWITRRAIVNLK